LIFIVDLLRASGLFSGHRFGRDQNNPAVMIAPGHMLGHQSLFVGCQK
jgi:hypothetical protein